MGNETGTGLGALRDEVLGVAWNGLLLSSSVVHGVTMAHYRTLVSPAEDYRQMLMGYPDSGKLMDEARTDEGLLAADLHTELGRVGEGGRWSAAVVSWHVTGGGDFSVTDQSLIDAGEQDTGDGWVLVSARPDGTAELIMRGGTSHATWLAFREAFAAFCDGSLR